MASVEVKMMVPKESKEIVDFVVKLIKDLKAKKDLTMIATESLPLGLAAVQGYEQVEAEVKGADAHGLIAYAGSELYAALKG